MAGALLIGLAATASQAVTVEAVKSTPPVELALKLLPPETAARVIGGATRRAWLPGVVYDVHFWERPRTKGGPVCGRRWHHVVLKASQDAAESPELMLEVSGRRDGEAFGISHAQPAINESCAHVRGFAGFPEGGEAEARKALTALSELMQRAGSGDSSLKISCEAEAGDDACEDPVRALATLPLDALGSVSFDTGHHRVLSGIQKGDGGAVRLVQQVPAPDASPPVPMIGFGPSGNDRRSWRVTIRESDDGNPEVTLRRSTVIYH